MYEAKLLHVQAAWLLDRERACTECESVCRPELVTHLVMLMVSPTLCMKQEEMHAL